MTGNNNPEQPKGTPHRLSYGDARQKLFDYFEQGFGVILVHSEMDDIQEICKQIEESKKHESHGQPRA